MSEVKRYRVELDVPDEDGDQDYERVEDQAGPYVLHADHARILAEREATIAKLEANIETNRVEAERLIADTTKRRDAWRRLAESWDNRFAMANDPMFKADPLAATLARQSINEDIANFEDKLIELGEMPKGELP